MSTPAERLVVAAQLLEQRGLNSGTSGNLSVRAEGGLWVTPSAIEPPALAPDAIVRLDMEGEVLSGGVPTSEWRIHRDVYARRPDVQAIVHTHSTYATALASLRADLPAFHYQVAKAGGHVIRCAEYATYGTQELSDSVITALGDTRAALMANHGMIALGIDLHSAVALATEVEVLCRQYLIAKAAGTPVLLTSAQMDEAAAKLARYGQPEG